MQSETRLKASTRSNAHLQHFFIFLLIIGLKKFSVRQKKNFTMAKDLNYVPTQGNVSQLQLLLLQVTRNSVDWNCH
jgi:hypothetical protein